MALSCSLVSETLDANSVDCFTRPAKAWALCHCHLSTLFWHHINSKMKWFLSFLRSIHATIMLIHIAINVPIAIPISSVCIYEIISQLPINNVLYYSCWNFFSLNFLFKAFTLVIS